MKHLNNYSNPYIWQHYVFTLLTLLLLLPGSQLMAQQKFRYTGSLSAQAIGYTAHGIEARRAPFYWQLSGNLTLNYWKISAPFSFTLSEQEQTYRYPQPFNQFGTSPTYKYITLHLGYRSMNFSEFTLAGTLFMGIGAEVAPPEKNVKVSAMYGRFSKGRLTGGLNDLELGTAAYERWGYGAKVTIGKNGQGADFILFRGRDDPGSIPDSAANVLGISPAENLVWGLNLRRNLSQRFTIHAEYALSAYAKDVRSTEHNLSTHGYLNHVGNLYTPTLSSQVNSAFQGQLAYKADRYQLTFKYRRLGPEYKTMGSPYMNNDFEDFTTGMGTALLSGKLNVSGNVGLQRNNLDHSHETRVSRFIGSANTTYAVNEKMTVSLNYSNFNSTTKQDRYYQQSQVDQIDSLLYLQTTHALTASINYILKKGDVSSSLLVNGNYQTASDNQANNSVFYNGNAGYQLTNTINNANFNANVNVNANEVGGIKNVSGGPTFNAGKKFLEKKIQCNTSVSYIRAYQADRKLSDNLTTRLTGRYANQHRHTFGVDVSWLKRTSYTETTASFTEFRGGITYQYGFSN